MKLPVDPRLLLDNGPVVSYVFDSARSIFLYLSANIERWLDLPADALVGTPDWQARVEVDDRQGLASRLATRGDSPRLYRFRLHAQDGRVVHVEDHPLPQQDDSELRLGYWTNVTAEMLSYAAHAGVERSLQDLVKDLTDIYYRTDREGRLIQLSGAALELFAAPVEQVLGKSVADYYLEPDGREKFIQALNANGGRIHAYQAPMRREDGEIIWVSTSAHYVYDEHGEVAGVEGLVRNITDQKAAEQALHEEQDFNHTVFNTLGSLVVVLNRKGEVIRFNSAAERLTGYRFEELRNQPIWDHLILPEDVDAVRGVFSQLISGMCPATHENYWRSRDGGRRLIAWSNACITDADGMVTHVVATGTDVTDQRASLEALQVSEERFRELAENLNEVFWLCSVDWQQVHYVSPAYTKIWGDPAESLYRDPLSWAARIHPDDQGAVSAFLDCVDLDQDELIFPDYRICRDDGGIRWIASRAYPIRDEGGTPIRIAGIAEDITERREAEDMLRRSSVAFDNTSEAILVMDAGRRIITVNPAFSTITGYHAEQAIGETPDTLFAGDDIQTEQMDWESIYTEAAWQGETWLRRADGERFPAWSSITPVYDDRGMVTHYVCLFADISNVKQSQKDLDFLAHHDTLTKLPNRLLLNARLEAALQQAHRQSNHVALLFIDLDRFKNINDSLGHSVGDQLLVDAADRLRTVLREGDTLARLGGDEFVVVMNVLPDSRDAMVLAGRITHIMRRPFIIDDQRLHVTASIGISTYPQDGTDIDSLMKNADAAMYRAKERGRDNYQFYTHELTQSAMQRVTLENALRRALDKQAFELHFQPQLSLSDGRVIGAEALVRWHHPEQGLVPPDQFIPLAEETGLILPLGEWVLQEACQQAMAWQRAGADIQRIAVNISGIQIQRGDIGQMVRDALQSSGLPANQLELELTESSLMGQGARVVRKLEDLRSLGVSFAIDDFGTGYSSLAYLKRLPIDRVKIDRVFIRDVGLDANDEAIIRAIIVMARTLQLQVVAEGVERPDQHYFLTQLGCDIAQGYYYGRPLPASDFLSMLLRPDAGTD